MVDEREISARKQNKPRFVLLVTSLEQMTKVDEVTNKFEVKRTFSPVNTKHFSN